MEQRAIFLPEQPPWSPGFVRWLIDAGACVHTEVSLDGYWGLGAKSGKVDVLFIAAAAGESKYLRVLLDTGMESRLHDDAELYAAAGLSIDADDVMTVLMQEWFQNQPDLDLVCDLDHDLLEIAHVKVEDTKQAIREMMIHTFEERALVQAYRRLAICFGACSSRLGAESPVGLTNYDVIDHLLTRHLLIGKRRMPGAVVQSAVLERFAQQTWPSCTYESK